VKGTLLILTIVMSSSDLEGKAEVHCLIVTAVTMLNVLVHLTPWQ